MIDLAYRYVGFGYVMVLSYDPISGGVFTGEGGDLSGPTISLETWWKREVDRQANLTSGKKSTYLPPLKLPGFLRRSMSEEIPKECPLVCVLLCRVR